MRLCKHGKRALLLKWNGVKNNEMFLFLQKCWAWHIFCCRKTWRHNVSVCHLAGECNTTSLACLSCVAKVLFLFSLRESLHSFCRVNRDTDRAAGKMCTNVNDNPFCTLFILILKSSDDAVVRALASNQCGPLRFDSRPVPCVG